MPVLYKQYDREHRFSISKSGFLVHARQRVSTWLARNKNPGHQFWVDNIYMGFCNSLLRELGLGNCMNSQKLTICFLWTLPHAPFIFADFSLYLFTVYNSTIIMTICWVVWGVLVNQWTFCSLNSVTHLGSSCLEILSLSLITMDLLLVPMWRSVLVL